MRGRFQDSDNPLARRKRNRGPTIKAAAAEISRVRLYVYCFIKHAQLNRPPEPYARAFTSFRTAEIAIHALRLQRHWNVDTIVPCEHD